MKTNYVKPMSEIAITMYESMLMLQDSGHQSNDGDAKGGVFDEEDEDLMDDSWENLGLMR